MGELFAVSALVLRRRWRPSLLLALVLEAPALLLGAAADLEVADLVTRALPVSADGRIAGGPSPVEPRMIAAAIAWSVALVALVGLASAIATPGFARIVETERRAAAVTFGDAMRACIACALRVVGLVILTSAVTVAVIGLVLGVMLLLLVVAPPGPDRGGLGVFGALLAAVAGALLVILLTVRWAPALPALALEDVGVVTALRRAWHLTSENAWRTGTVLASATVVAALLGGLLGRILGLLLVDGLASRLGAERPLEALVSALSAVLVAPIVPVVTSVLYFDLCARHVGVAAAHKRT